jgi:hypothetical protein
LNIFRELSSFSNYSCIVEWGDLNLGMEHYSVLPIGQTTPRVNDTYTFQSIGTKLVTITISDRDAIWHNLTASDPPSYVALDSNGLLAKTISIPFAVLPINGIWLPNFVFKFTFHLISFSTFD